MAEFTEVTTTTYTVHCPACECERVVKIGKRNGQQRYLCRNCKKKFRANGKAEGRRMDAEMMGSAIRDFYTGKSYKQIAEGLRDEYDIPEPSKATIFEWVRDYSDQAAAEMEGHKAQTGDTWVADELVVDVGGKKAWLWNVMDGKTRYILASHLSRERDAEAAKTVMRKALASADKPPDNIFTDKLRSYLPALREVLPKTKHFQSQGFAADINNNLSERLQGTYRDRIKTLRGLDSIESGQRYLDGWQITYNLFRGHESLHNDTPGKRAKVNPPFREWADIVRGTAPPPLPPEPDKPRPVRQSLVTRIQPTPDDMPPLRELAKAGKAQAAPPALTTKPEARLPDAPELAKAGTAKPEIPKCQPVKPKKGKGWAASKHPFYQVRERGKGKQTRRKG